MNKDDFIKLLKDNYDEEIEVSYINSKTLNLHSARFIPTKHGVEYCDITYVNTHTGEMWNGSRPIYRGIVFEVIPHLQSLLETGEITYRPSPLTGDYYLRQEKYRQEYKQKIANIESKRNKQDRSGVYVIKQGKCVKIGVSTNFQSRLNSMQTASHEILELVCFFEGASYKFEGELHKTFDKYWVRGEWFKSKIIPKILEIHSQYSQTYK
jgi:hypothetical protein